MRTTASGERILTETVWLEAPVADVWAAYTTSEGWTAWASPKAEIDLRAGGSILTQYDKTKAIGDDGTNRLTIVSYVPEEILTLKADVSANWPELLKQDAENLCNVILFEAMGENRTRIRSFGLGYGDSQEYDALLDFFAQANAGLLAGLKHYVEDGVRSDF